MGNLTHLGPIKLPSFHHIFFHPPALLCPSIIEINSNSISTRSASVTPPSLFLHCIHSSSFFPTALRTFVHRGSSLVFLSSSSLPTRKQKFASKQQATMRFQYILSALAGMLATGALVEASPMRCPDVSLPCYRMVPPCLDSNMTAEHSRRHPERRNCSREVLQLRQMPGRCRDTVWLRLSSRLPALASKLDDILYVYDYNNVLHQRRTPSTTR